VSTENDTALTDNELRFLDAARKMAAQEGGYFCFVDLNLHGYACSFETQRATLGSLVKKGIVHEPVDGWSSIVDG
jgi:hypothetical protein